ncbi:TldD/PmbA family protein [Roseisolibacter sp. H3M3-2]|uniref:TldD/PmbA family protein n=1 Tax=Roseisolibacter sp. H3M3-2 TaxID=3031323 RepID=UPI0023DB122F|nr:TldD/PmbA family protein [Roseisolibacter sp. H3M3-2]MDF1504500.1 TldD/PmbA family protein [Roseisolibacter sp. H3M3-2]
MRADLPLAEAADQALVTREQAQAIVEKAVKLSKADGIDVQVNSSYRGNTRFAANQMSTAGATTDAALAIQSSFGPKHAVVTTNDLSDEAIRRAVEQSERLARLAPDDPEAMPALPAQQYRGATRYFESTAALTPADRARAALTALELSRAAGDLHAAGYLVTGMTSLALGNKAGLFAYDRATNANYTLTVRTTDGTGSGWAAADHPDFAQLDARRVAERAVEKARRSRNPQAIEPGRYTVILEPQAVGDLVQLIANYADARQSDEGRSPFVKQGGGNKIGERIVDPRVTLYSDPTDAQLLAQPFDGDGLPLTRQTWIENGTLKALYYSRFWAKKQGKTATGAPSSLKMAGGDTGVEQMIASTPRGVLVTRLWYLREVDPRTILYTGLTRDGTFLIEDGKITRALRNFRFNESPLFMLNNLEAIGPAERLAGTEAGGDVSMPTLKVRDFNFTSLSEAV